MTRFLQMILVSAIVGTLSLPALAQTSDDIETLDRKDVPPAVTAQLRCKTPEGQPTRRAFAGGFVYVQRCMFAGRGAEDVLVFAADKTGANARLLQFHRPEGRRVSSLANVAWNSKEQEIAGHVGRLSRRICRAEGRWKLEGKPPSPALVYWRHTRDCDGKTGWQTMVNRKS